MDRPSLLKPTLIGGVVFGVLGSIPCVGALNMLCCSLVMGSGFIAAYFYSNECKKIGAEFGAVAGAKLGVLSGLIYWLVSSIVNGLFQIFFPTDFDDILEQMESGGMPPEMLESIEPVFEMLSGSSGVVLILGVTFVLSMIFATIGGLIGGAVFKVAGGPPVPPGQMAPPPPPAPPADFGGGPSAGNGG